MSRPVPAPRRDLSRKSGNPTSALQDAYQQLMAIKDPNELMRAAVGVVRPLVGSGMSEANYQTFIKHLQTSAKRGVVGVQQYLSNYILSGSGMSVDLNSIQAAASFITEDVNDTIRLTPQQQYLKTLVESNTNFKVALEYGVRY